MLDSDKFSTRQDLRSKKSMNQAQNNKKAQIENKRRMKPTKSYGLPKLKEEDLKSHTLILGIS